VALKLVCLSTYLTSIAVWRRVDRDAHDFVQALKDYPIREYSSIRVRGQWHRFDNGNRQQVVTWFGPMAADYMRREGPSPPFVLVPVPSSMSGPSFCGVNTPTRMATAIAHQYSEDVRVEDVLRWNCRMIPAHHGGTRHPRLLYERLLLLRPVADAHVVGSVPSSGGNWRTSAVGL